MITYKRLMIQSTFLFFLAACSQSSSDRKSTSQTSIPQPELLSFSFLTANNPELSADVFLNFDESSNTFAGVIPENISVKNLTATFQFLGSRHRS